MSKYFRIVHIVLSVYLCQVLFVKESFCQEKDINYYRSLMRQSIESSKRSGKTSGILILNGISNFKFIPSNGEELPPGEKLRVQNRRFHRPRKSMTVGRERYRKSSWNYLPEFPPQSSVKQQNS